MTITLSAKQFAGSFSYFRDGSTRPPVHQDPYVVDLDGDGVDEVVFAGLETQPNTPAEFSALTLRIFGWRQGVFQDLSSKWLPSGAGEVQGVGSIEFGDFNHDGRTDLFLSAYADMTWQFRPYVLLNTGSALTRKELPVVETWQHGADAADINGDGYDDVVATGYGGAPSLYLGGPAGLMAVPFTNYAGGSDVALGDFVGDGTVQAVFVDSWPNGADTVLVRIKLSSDKKSAEVQDLDTLPAPRLENLATSAEESHDARCVAADFNSDGRLDVIVYSRQAYDGQQWPHVSAVQFLANLGEGLFRDVTADLVSGYNVQSMIPYAPVVRDLDQDGRIDLYLDGVSWGRPHDSAAFLMQDATGHFVATGRELLAGQIDDQGGISTVARGPDGNLALVTLQIQSGQGRVSTQAIGFPDRETSETLAGSTQADTILGRGGNDLIEGLEGNDHLEGGTGDDTFMGGEGNDWIDGGSGTDTLVLQGLAREYRASLAGGNGTVTDTTAARDGIDTVRGIEHLRFADYDINTGMKAAAQGISAATLQRVIELYVAFFDRTPDADGLAYWLGQSRSGMSIPTIGDAFYNAGIQYPSLTGYSASMTNDDFVNIVYRNVLGRPEGADADGLAYWSGRLAEGTDTRGSLVSKILDSAHSFKGDATWGWVADLLDNKITVARHVALDWGINGLTPQDSVSQGMAIVDAITATDTSAAIALVGMPSAGFTLT